MSAWRMMVQYRVGLAAILIVTVLVALIPAIAEAAYNASGAVQYSERYWDARNPKYPDFSSNCTNFVSQCMHEGGGIPFDVQGDSSWEWWWCYWDGREWSYTKNWTVASWCKGWLLGDGHGSSRGYWSYAQPNSNSSITNGDIIFYDWTTDGTVDHASINCGWGTDETMTNYTGDLINQNTRDRHHAIWHLIPYNQNYKTTRVYAVKPY